MTEGGAPTYYTAMKRTSAVLIALLLTTSVVHLGMSRNAQYDEDAREVERREQESRKLADTASRKNPAKNIATGVKEATFDSTRGFITDTAEGTLEEPPVIGTIEGARKGTEKILDGTVKGAVRVATLGFGHVDSYEVLEPEKGSEETTTIKIALPGT
ncbi:MAG: hypothetical protein Q8R76_12200 [Candidatus Omnitrophota bacterium]|nr:hypothetical protein [Candidatus Omnitrophota bacterium]